MIIASIDIGTNTVLLLIAQADKTTKKIKVLKDEYRIPRIGKGLKPDLPFSSENINALIKVLKDYSKIINNFSCEEVLITATNAFRIASNSKEIISMIKEKFNYSVRVATGNEEAKLSFLGAVKDFNSKHNSLIIDIGGGSSELIYGTMNKINYSKSFQAGVVSGKEGFLHHDPPLSSEINDFDKHLNSVFDELRFQDMSPENAIAIAGTPTTLACIKQKLSVYDESRIEGSELKLSEIKKLIHAISTLSSDEIRRKYNSVVDGRQDVLLAGSYILFKIMKLLNLDKVIVSTKGIRYGAIVEYLLS